MTPTGRGAAPARELDEEQRKEAARPIREWFERGCIGEEPAVGLVAALEHPAEEPLELTGDHIGYLDALFGNASVFLPPVRTDDGPTDTELRSALIERGVLVEAGPGRGAFSAALAPEYLATVGTLYFAPRATAVSITGTPGRAFVLARAPQRAALLERVDDDRWRLAQVAPHDAVARISDEVPRDGAAPAGGDWIVVSDEEYERYIDLSLFHGRPDAAVAAVPALAEYHAAREHGVTAVAMTDTCSAAGARQSETWSFEFCGGQTWQRVYDLEANTVRLRPIGSADVRAVVEECLGEPGRPAEQLAAARAAEVAAAHAVATAWQASRWTRAKHRIAAVRDAIYECNRGAVAPWRLWQWWQHRDDPPVESVRPAPYPAPVRGAAPR